MELKPDDKFGDRYQLLSKLGEGGMGEVWKARDTELDRDVALKVSKAEFTARFRQEARAMAAFNHQNICHIHDVGPNYIVMELIDGAPLTGPLPVEKAVAQAGFILDALDAAHRKGFTHRDLKPANVLVAKTGTLKLLDFGLAKQQPTGLGPDDVTIQAAMTAQGQITGTLQYMSPEQLNGKDADARSDIFAFGCVLYEMLSGKKAFGGSTAASVIAAIMEREPEPLNTTPPLDRVIRTCLEKDPDKRFQSVIDLKRAMLWATATPAESEATAANSVAPATPRRRWWWLAGAAVAGLIAGYLIYPALWPDPPDSPNLKMTPFATSGHEERNARWSPDGKSLAYTERIDGVVRVVVRGLENPTPIVLSPASCTADTQVPFWPPDGREVYYRCMDGVFASPAVGGEPRLVLGGTGISAADISPDGKTLAVIKGPAFQVFLSSPVGSALKEYPQTSYRNTGDSNVASLDYLRYSPDGRSFYTRDWVFDASGTGGRQVTRLRGRPGTWAPDSATVAVPVPPIRGQPSRLAAIGIRGGSARNLLRSPNGEMFSADLSLDGKRFAISFGGNDTDIVELPVDGGEIRPLLATSRSEEYPRWLPQQNALVYATNREGMPGIWARELQGRWERPVVRSVVGAFGLRNLGLSVSPDGTRIGYLTANSKEMWLVPVSGGSPIRIHTAAPQELNLRPDWSPDGQWLVFETVKAGIRSLVKMRVGANQPPVVIAEGITNYRDRWSPDGNWIAIRRQGRIVLLSPDGKTSRDVGALPLFRSCAVWAKDSRIIYVVDEAGGHHQLRILEVAGPHPSERIAANYPASVQLDLSNGCELSPDGKTIAATRLNSTSDIWIVDGVDLTRSWWSRLFPRGVNPRENGIPVEDADRFR